MFISLFWVSHTLWTGSTVKGTHWEDYIPSKNNFDFRRAIDIEKFIWIGRFSPVEGTIVWRSVEFGGSLGGVKSLGGSFPGPMSFPGEKGRDVSSNESKFGTFVYGCLFYGFPNVQDKYKVRICRLKIFLRYFSSVWVPISKGWGKVEPQKVCRRRRDPNIHHLSTSDWYRHWL